MVRRAVDRPGLADLLMLAVTVVISLTLLSAGEGFRSATARVLSKTLFLPFRLTLAYARGPIDVSGEMRRMRESLALQSLSQTELREALLENARLREMVGFAAREPRLLVPARVVGRSADRFGEIVAVEPNSSGAREGQAVVSTGGLVGVVIQSGLAVCRIRTIRHAGQPVSAMLENSRDVGMLRWDEISRKLRLEGLPIGAVVADSAQVITSGFGGIFPKGIAIGRVEVVGEDSTTLVKEILVAPATDFDHVEEVFLLDTDFGN